MKGLMHFYYGDGKGKSTAALGLALRAAGHGKSVCVVQFLKGAPSGEVKVLNELGIDVLRCTETKFVYQMTPEEKAELKRVHDENLAAAISKKSDVLILDEAADALNLNVLSEDLIRRAVFERPENTELIVTGHTKIEWICAAADYITNMKKEKHPFDAGVPARKGVEF